MRCPIPNSQKKKIGKKQFPTYSDFSIDNAHPGFPFPVVWGKGSLPEIPEVFFGEKVLIPEFPEPRPPPPLLYLTQH